jgi:DNA topoisomerase I
MWLAKWKNSIDDKFKYIMPSVTSKMKGQNDWQKFETARKLGDIIHGIRQAYREDWQSDDVMIRQRAVALYFIDKASDHDHQITDIVR